MSEYCREKALKKSVERNPLYLQAKDLLLGRLRAGEWKPGDKLPAEITLASELGVSLGTLRRAVEMLVADGVLERRQGAGTFAATFQKKGYANRFQLFESVDGSPRFDERRLFRFERCGAPAEAAAGLGIREGDTVIHIVRHMVLHEKTADTASPTVRVTGIDELFLLPDVFPELTELLFLTRFADNDSLYKFYDRELGVVITSQKCTIRYECLTGEDARALGVPSPMPVLRFSRTSMTLGRRPVEFRIYRSDAGNSKISFDLS